MLNIKKQQNLSDLLFLLRRNIIKSVKKEGVKGDLTFSQIEVLHFIGLSSQNTMKSVADFLKITPPSVTELIKEMEIKNLVKRVNDKKDKRITFVMLTDRAKKKYISISRKKEVFLNNLVSKLKNKDKKELIRIINILNKE